VQVTHEDGQIGVTHQMLQGVDIHAISQALQGKPTPEIVRGLDGNAGIPAPPFKQFPQPRFTEAVTFIRCKQWRILGELPRVRK